MFFFLWDKAFPNCAYTVDREKLQKFPDMLPSAKVCAQLRGGAAETGKAGCFFSFLFFSIVVIYYCYFHQRR